MAVWASDVNSVQIWGNGGNSCVTYLTRVNALIGQYGLGILVPYLLSGKRLAGPAPDEKSQNRKRARLPSRVLTATP